MTTTTITVTESFELDDEWFSTLAEMAPTFGYVWAESVRWDATKRTVHILLTDDGLAERADYLGPNRSRSLVFEAEIIANAAARTLGEVRSDLRHHLDLAIREGDAGEIDAEVSDCVLQVLVFGKLVFG